MPGPSEGNLGEKCSLNKPAGDNVHVEGVLDSSNGASGQHHLLPGLLQVDDVNTIVLKRN